jgi:hypothetical protein
MKYSYIPFIISIVTPLLLIPTPVEGTLLLIPFVLINLAARIFYPTRRNDRECNILKESAGLTNAAACKCQNEFSSGVTYKCDPMKQQICMTLSDDEYCTSANPDDSLIPNANSTSYTATSGNRTRLAWSSPEVRIATEAVFGRFVEAPNYINYFFFDFVQGDSASSSSKYATCEVASASIVGTSSAVRVTCNSCSICDNGVDFKYDCSNARGTFMFNNTTNTTELGPGPKLESCIPVASVLPLF